jgi:hypothetical protein
MEGLMCTYAIAQEKFIKKNSVEILYYGDSSGVVYLRSPKYPVTLKHQ